MTEALSPLVDSTDAGTAGEGGMWMGSSHSHGIDANTYSVIGQPSAASAVVTTSTEFASVPAVSYAIVAPPADFTGSTGAATTFAAYDSSNVTYQYNTDPSTTVSIDVAPVTVPSATGFTINLIWDAAALAAPASFRAGVQQAANLLMATITDHITVNLNIDYSGTGGGAAAGPDNGQFMSYATVRSDLIANAAPGDTTFNALPAGTSLQGQSNVVVWNAQLKLFGLLSANSATTDDGTATFATDINPALLPGVALHELTHALGRVPYGPEPDIFDLFRFTSVGTRLFDGNIPAAASYFSLNNGVTKLADYGQNSDTSDFLNSGVQGANDPFNEFYTGGTLQTLTLADVQQLVALGFHANLNSTFAITPLSADKVEGSGGGTTAYTFTVTRTGPMGLAATVNYQVSGGGNAAIGPAADAADFSGGFGSGTLTWAANDTSSRTITVLVNADGTVENDEVFTVGLTAGSGAAISSSQGSAIGVIRNDDTSQGYDVVYNDTTNQFDWTVATLHYDGLNRLTNETIDYDNGTHAKLFWDVANQNTWSDFVEYYDSSMRMTSKLTHNDNGSSSLQGFDVLNQNSWSDYIQNFDAQGKLISQTLHQDDGGHLDLAWDPYNLNSWSDTVVAYDSLSRKTLSVTNNDSGTHDVQVWDVTNQGSWADEILNYNSTWQVTHLTVHNDDGTRIEQGWDLANQQTWKDVTTYFDVAGQKTQEFYHNDDGGYSSAGWDTTNVSPLANWFYQYNAQNQLVHYSVTYDNGQTYSA